jgi:hypothetical protein
MSSQNSNFIITRLLGDLSSSKPPLPSANLLCQSKTYFYDTSHNKLFILVAVSYNFTRNLMFTNCSVLRSFIPIVLLEQKQLCKGMAVITQLYCQLHITYKLHVSAIFVVAIIRLDTIIRENYMI